MTRQKLALAGVETIGQLAGMTEKEAITTLGAAAGRGLWLMARGVDEREVAARAEAKQISAEHTYDTDLRTKEAVDKALHRAAAQAHRRLLADGRVARTVTVKLRMTDFHIESRSLTLPYTTSELKTLEATALKLVRYPNEVGAIRLVGVSFSGLSEVSQDVLFPELDLPTEKDLDPEPTPAQPQPQPQPASEQWRATQDVYHPEYGHGWIQGIGHGKLTVRFETRTTASGQGKTKTFDVTDPELKPADPLDSLDWDDLRTE